MVVDDDGLCSERLLISSRKPFRRGSGPWRSRTMRLRLLLCHISRRWFVRSGQVRSECGDHDAIRLWEDGDDGCRGGREEVWMVKRLSSNLQG